MVLHNITPLMSLLSQYLRFRLNRCIPSSNLPLISESTYHKFGADIDEYV